MTETVKPVTQIVIDNDEQMYELNGDVMREIITLHHTDYSYYLFDRMTAFEIHFDREVYVRVYRYGYVAEQAKDEYVSSLLGDIAKLQSDLDNEKLNCNRFQQLYCKSLATLIQVQDALKKNDINAITQIVVDAFTVLEEIEAKSIEESNICWSWVGLKFDVIIIKYYKNVNNIEKYSRNGIIVFGVNSK